MLKRPNDLRSGLAGLRPLGVAAALLLGTASLGCRDAAGPTPRELVLAVTPTIQGGTSGLVDVDRARFLVRDLGTEAIVLDTTVTIADGVSTVDVQLRVPLGDATTGVFFLTMQLIDAQGVVVFTGSATVTAFPEDEVPEPVPIELTYTGPGADAVAVQIVTTADETLFGSVEIVAPGAQLALSANALDDADQPIPNTPIGWRSLDPLVVSVVDPATGLVMGGSQEGTAEVVAELLTGQADTVTVFVSFGASAVSLEIVPPQIPSLFGVVAVLDFNQEAVYTSVALDDQGVTVLTPVGWRSLEPLVADFPDPTDGRVVAGPARGTARIVAQLINGLADTVTLIVAPPDEFIVVSVDDPIDDTFGAQTPQQDILVFGAAVDATSIVIGIQFTADVAPANEFAPNSVVGFVDLDVDQNVQTGVMPQTDDFRPPEDTNTTGMGAEYYISLFDVNASGEVPLVDAATDLEMARLPAVFERDVVIITLPLALIGDDGNMNLATIMGTPGEQTDLAPNAGALTAFASLPAPPSLVRSPAPAVGPRAPSVAWRPR